MALVLWLQAGVAPVRADAPVVSSAAGSWSELAPPSGRSGHTVIDDAAHHRLILFGGFDGNYRNDLWVLSYDAAPAWTTLAVPGGPSPRSGHCAIYDPSGQRMIVFGGMDAAGYLGDTWLLSLVGTPTWTEFAGTGPSARADHTGIYDPARQRLIVFSGDDGGIDVPSDCWGLSLSGTMSWSQLSVAGTGPTGRREHAAIYDPVRGRMLVFGGEDGVFYFNATYALDLTSLQWSALAVSGTPPAVRSGHSAIYDPVRDRLLVCGGANGAYRYNDCWALALAAAPTWSAVTTTGTPPSARAQHAAVYDSVRDRMLVVGGFDGGHRSDVQALALTPSPAWSTLLGANMVPSGRYRASAVVDPIGRRMLLFGGYDGTVPYPSAMWSLSLGDSARWSTVVPVGDVPAGRYGHSAVYDPVRARMLVFGGHDGTSRVNAVWAFVPGTSATWTLLAPVGTPPPARQNHTAIYDPVRDRMVVFGGFDGARLNDVWSLSLAGTPAWQLVLPNGTPPTGRTNAAAQYDPVGDRIVVVGGSDGTLHNDVWALALGGTPAWSMLAPTGNPPSPRAGATLVYDPVRQRMVLCGGDDGSFRGDTWALDLTQPPVWSELAPTGWMLPGRRYHTAVYDPWQDGLLLHGGWDGDYRDDAWDLVWGEPVAPQATCPSEQSVGRGATLALEYDLHNVLAGTRTLEWTLESERSWPGFPMRGRAVVGALATQTLSLGIVVPDTAQAGPNRLRFTVALAGAAGNGRTCDTPLLVSAQTSDTQVANPDVLILHGIQPNPVWGGMRLACTAGAAGRILLEMFDTAGRRVLAPQEMQVVHGPQVLEVDATQRLPPGVYFVRLRLANETVTRRVIVLR